MLAFLHRIEVYSSSLYPLSFSLHHLFCLAYMCTELFSHEKSTQYASSFFSLSLSSRVRRSTEVEDERTRQTRRERERYTGEQTLQRLSFPDISTHTHTHAVGILKIYYTSSLELIIHLTAVIIASFSCTLSRLFSYTSNEATVTSNDDDLLQMHSFHLSPSL